MDGRHVRKLELPGIGTASGFSGKRSDTETFYAFSSFNTPASIFKYDLLTGQSQLWKAPTTLVKPDDYQVDQVFYQSKDGTRVPMFLAYKKGLKRDGSNPTLLYGYGGFNIPLTPTSLYPSLAYPPSSSTPAPMLTLQMIWCLSIS